MKKLLLIVLIGMGIVLIGIRVWIYLFPVEPIYYQEQDVVAEVAPAPIKIKPIPKPSFRCDGRQHCSQMKSYDEAKYFIQNCPNTKMDGDHDGIPCERQFRR